MEKYPRIGKGPRIHLEVPETFTPDKFMVMICSCGGSIFQLLREKKPPYKIGLVICNACGDTFEKLGYDA